VRPLLRRLALRLVAAFLVMATVGVLAGEAYARLVLPVHRFVLTLAFDDYRTQSLRLELEGQPRFVWSVASHRPIPVGARILPANVPMSASTLAGHSVQHLVLLYMVILAWPQSGWRARTWVLLLSVPALLLVEALDVPFVLRGSVEDLVRYQLAPETLKTNWLVIWMDVMNSGGRLALSLAAALGVLGIGRALEPSPAPP
jgi:hypothetical protein